MLPHRGQQQTSREKLLWQQQLMYRKLLELQRHQQVQQVDQGSWQPNLLNQAVAKQAGVSQLPNFLNGLPVIDASKQMVQNGSGEYVTPNTQMFNAGNVNLSHSRGSLFMRGSDGFMFSNNYGRPTQPMGFVSQQMDQTLHGTPVSSNSGLLSQYLPLQYSNFNDVMTKSGEDQLTRTIMQAAPSNYFHNDQCIPVQACLQDGLSSTAQCSQGRNLNENITAENFQETNHSQLSIQIHEPHNRYGQAGWSTHIEETSESGFEPFLGGSSLDPIEAKILFGLDDGDRVASFSTGGALRILPDSGDQFQSVQSGSWSALMQDVVEASSSDQGFQEEWSGLSYQTSEQSFMNHSTVSRDIDKQQPAWNNSSSDNFHSSANLQVFNSSNDGAADSDSNDHMYGQFIKRTKFTGLEFNSQNNENMWAQHVPVSNVASQTSSNPDGWTKSLATSGDSSLDVHYNEGRVHIGSERTNHINHKMNQQVINRHQVDLMKHAAFESFWKSRGGNVLKSQHQTYGEQNVQDSTMNDVDCSPSVSDSQTSSGLSCWKSVGSCGSQYQKNVNSGMNLGTVDSAKVTSYAQGVVIPNSEYQDESYYGHSYLAGIGVSNTGHSAELQQGIKEPEDLQHLPMQSQDVPVSYFCESSGSAKNIQTRQNMAELINNAGQPMENSTFPDFANSNRNTLGGLLHSIAQGNSAGVATSYFPYQIQRLQPQQTRQMHQQIFSRVTGSVTDGDGIVRQAAASSSSMLHTPAANSGQKSFLSSQAEQIYASNMSRCSTDVGVHGHSMTPSDFQQQIQYMQGDTSDVSKMTGKRFKVDFNSDSSKGYVSAPNAVDNRVLSDCELSTASPNSFSQDLKMLSSSVENEEMVTGRTSQTFRSDLHSQDSSRNDDHAQTQPRNSTSEYIGRIRHGQSSPQMALFEHYQKYKETEIVAVHDDQSNARASPQQYLSAENEEVAGSNKWLDQKIEKSQFTSLVNSTSSGLGAVNEFSPRLPLITTDHETVARSKKRKYVEPEMLPWHQEVLLEFQRLQCISSAERDWARVANRLIEKVVDEHEPTEAATVVSRARRRLILTSYLVQQLLPPVPALILTAEVTLGYEHVIYFLAKSAVGGACSLLACTGGECPEHVDGENRMLDKVQKASENFYLKIVEASIERSRMLETNLLRLDRRTSLLDVRLECLEIERFSLANQLGKFHGCSQAAGAVNASLSQKVAHNLFPRRYVTRHAMAGNLPEGMICFSL